MNVYDAMKYAFEGQMIKRRSKGEWVIATNKLSQLRYAKNRQITILTPDDVVATDWMVENDEILISKNQLEESIYKYNMLLDNDTKQEFFKSLGFK